MQLLDKKLDFQKYLVVANSNGTSFFPANIVKMLYMKVFNCSIRNYFFNLFYMIWFYQLF